MFSLETVRFLKDLKVHNDRDWFQAHKPRYESHVKEAAKAFAASLGERLGDRYGEGVQAKIFRIFRDLRFSKDKRPYNTHIHMSFLDPEAEAAWMIGLETDKLMLGYGKLAFDRSRLERWRERVSGPGGEQLLGILQEVGGELRPPELKRVPAPYPADHPAAELLRRKGFSVWLDDIPVETSFGDEAPVRLLESFATLDPVRAWYVEKIG